MTDDHFMPAPPAASTLPAMLRGAARTLNEATSAAEVLDARDQAALAADLAGRFSRAHKAHDDITAAMYRLKGQALEIEARAKMRIADEYDAAQERGEVQQAGGDRKTIIPHENNDPGIGIQDGNTKATIPDLGISSKEIHEGRSIRDAEDEEPGRVSRIIDEKLDAGEEPTRAAIQPPPKKKRAPDSTKESLKLIGLWEKLSDKARGKFLDYLRSQGIVT